jgi:hypothetical protein
MPTDPPPKTAASNFPPEDPILKGLAVSRSMQPKSGSSSGAVEVPALDVPAPVDGASLLSDAPEPPHAARNVTASRRAASLPTIV